MATVTAFSIIERFLGFAYRIYLSRNLGSEGVGIYQIVLSVVGLLITLTASGIPITVSRMMIKNSTENGKNTSGNTVFSGIFLSLCMSLPVTVLAYRLALLRKFKNTASRHCYNFNLRRN